MSKAAGKVQAVIIDPETANALRNMAERAGISPNEIIKAGTTILKYALGRKIKIVGKNKNVEIDSLEKYDQMVDIDE